MYNFKTLKCYNCNSVITNLPDNEIKKLEGLTFHCECCDHKNILNDLKLIKAKNNNLISIFSLYQSNILDMHDNFDKK